MTTNARYLFALLTLTVCCAHPSAVAENTPTTEKLEELGITSAQFSQMEALGLATDEDKKNEMKGRREFAGLNFGVGISVTFDTGGNSRVKAASIVDNIVRIDNEDDKIARVMLESHYFFTPDKNFLRLEGLGKGRWGWGPFVALQPGTDEIIEAIGMGLMIGFRPVGNDSGSSWNIGLGYVTDPNVNILGEGFIENQAPPGGEEVIRLKEISQDGVVLLFSFSF